MSETSEPGSENSEPEQRKQRGRPFSKGKSGNPTGRRKRDAMLAEVARQDTWSNLLTGAGVASRDKRLSTFHRTYPVVVEEAADLWRGDALAARIIETWPNEMLREGFELCVVDDDQIADRKPGAALRRAREALDRAGGDVKKARQMRRDDARRSANAKNLVTQVCKAWEDLGFFEALWHALAYARAYGGGAILIGANDGEPDWSKPLNVERVSQVSYLTALEARELVPVKWYTDPMAPKFGKPAIYQLNPMRIGLPVEKPGETSATSALAAGSVYVHESRLVVFDGVRVSRLFHQSITFGWGDSVLTRVLPVLRDFNVAWSAAGTLVADFAQGVFKVKGLADLAAQDGKEAAATFAARMQMVDMSRSVTRSILLDAEAEDFKREQTPITGLPDLMDRFVSMLAAAADMPVTLLMGLSPAGLNATGASDIRFFYDRVASMQRRKLAPAIRYVTQILMASLGGEPEGWNIEFRPLWQPTEKEQAEARKTQADTDALMIDKQVLGSDEVRAQRYGGAEYSFATHVDLDADADMYETDPAAEASLREPLPTEPGAAPSGGDPAATAGAQPAPTTEPAKQAMNGAQVSSMVEVIKAVFAKEIPREAGIAILSVAFPISAEQAGQMLPENFEAAKPEPPANPFGGGGGFPPKPTAPPADPSGKNPTQSPASEEPSTPAGSTPDPKVDWNPDQPRAENGQFGEGGGEAPSGGASGGGGHAGAITVSLPLPHTAQPTHSEQTAKSERASAAATRASAKASDIATHEKASKAHDKAAREAFKAGRHAEGHAHLAKAQEHFSAAAHMRGTVFK
jgi:phage-related protein (TIGR01555 family)